MLRLAWIPACAGMTPWVELAAATRIDVMPAKAGIYARCPSWYSEGGFGPSAATMKTPCVYMITNHRDGVLYVGVTSDLSARMNQHTQGLLEGFSKRYGLKLLVYYEMHETMLAAIAREKQLKGWRRAWKVRLIEGFNPDWRNLFDLQSGEIAFGDADTQRKRF